jgi:hypothetical protein
MEIIYLIFLVFADKELESVHIHAWHSYQGAPEMVLEQSCESAIEDPAFQEAISRKIAPEKEGRLYCKTASDLPALRQLVNMKGVTVNPGYRESAEDAQEAIVIGKLVHRPYERGRRTLEAYMAQEFFLVNSDGDFAMYPSESVSKEDLLRLNGKDVELRVIFEDRTPEIDPGIPQAYPMEADGSPVPRTGYRVLEVVSP